MEGVEGSESALAAVRNSLDGHRDPRGDGRGPLMECRAAIQIGPDGRQKLAGPLHQAVIQIVSGGRQKLAEPLYPVTEQGNPCSCLLE